MLLVITIPIKSHRIQLYKDLSSMQKLIRNFNKLYFDDKPSIKSYNSMNKYEI